MWVALDAFLRQTLANEERSVGCRLLKILPEVIWIYEFALKFIHHVKIQSRNKQHLGRFLC